MAGNNTFPPAGPPVTKVIPSYLYQEYNDDDNLQALVAAFNNLAQQETTWFATINLPVYTQLSGAILDWIGSGYYGLPLPGGVTQTVGSETGALNTYAFNTMTYNGFKMTASAVFQATDDVYQRILTWHLYKGDGKVFSIRWLKRRIMRFLFGTNGTDPTAQTANTDVVSVTFTGKNQVNIGILAGLRYITAGAFYNGFAYNTMAFNFVKSSFVPVEKVPMAQIFKICMDGGLLEMPFQFTYVVTVE